MRERALARLQRFKSLHICPKLAFYTLLRCGVVGHGELFLISALLLQESFAGFGMYYLPSRLFETLVPRLSAR